MGIERNIKFIHIDNIVNFWFKGEPQAPIVLTAVETNNQVHPVESPLLIRLVDGSTPFEGRLELFHRGDWRAVCTNSRK